MNIICNIFLYLVLPEKCRTCEFILNSRPAAISPKNMNVYHM